MKSSRKNRGLAALVIFAVFGGLLVLAAPQAISLPQTGPNNYWGPRQGCPPSGIGAQAGQVWQCNQATDDIEGAEQIAPNGGRNVFECAGDSCSVYQHGTTPLDKPNNEASCSNSESFLSQQTEQLCNVKQNGNNNKTNIDFSATPNAPVNAIGVDQRSEQRYITDQDGVTNELHINGTENQSASAVNANVFVNHLQCTLMHADNRMQATSTNLATYNLNRTQTSTATGASTTQHQDSDNCAPEPDGTVVGVGDIDLVANSGGTQDIDVSGTDSKTETGTAELGNATQAQGNDTSGWDGTFTMNTGVSGGSGNPDLKIGLPDPANPDASQGGGLGKRYIMNGAAPNGQVDQSMVDGLPIKIPGSGSNKVGRVNTWEDLQASAPDAFVTANASINGFAAESLDFRMKGDVKAGNETNGVEVSRTGVKGPYDFTFHCQLNLDECPGGQSPSVVSATMDVSDADEPFDGNGAASVVQGDEFLYKVGVQNTGDQLSQAQNVIVTVPIPSYATFVECPETCPGEPNGDGAITWNLGNLQGGSPEVVRTLKLKLNSDAPTGPQAENKATGTYDPDKTFESNPTTVTVVAAPVPPTEITINILEDTLNVTNPKSGKATVQMFDKTIVPSTVCFGDLDEGQCTSGTNPTLGSNYLQMKFLVKNTGLDLGDKTACLTAQTTTGETVHGCDSIKTV